MINRLAALLRGRRAGCASSSQIAGHPLSHGLNDGAPGRGETAGAFALWAAAGLVVLSTHVGAAMWLMREEPMEAADNSPPPAVMVELADTPEAVETEKTDITQEKTDAAQSAPSEKVNTPPEEPVEEQPPEPVEPMPEAREEEEAEKDAPVLDKAEVPLPVSKPKPLQKGREKTEKKPPLKRRQQAQAASKQAVKAQAQVTPSSRTAASQSMSGLFSPSMTPARWQSRLMAHLERRKRYPSGARARGEKGIAYVRFRIDDAGNVLSASLARSSGYPELDDEVLALVKRASPVPKPPQGVNKTITAPVRFSEK